MGVLGSKGPNALKYWGSILSSAYAKTNVADMWTTIRVQQAQYGLARPGADAIDVNVIRGFANKIVNGAAALNAAAPSDSITSDMMAVAPYTVQDYAGIAATPTYMVRYQNTIEAADGSISVVWNTSVFTAAQFPGTVGELQAAVSTDAIEIAAQGMETSTTTPKGQSLGVGALEITVV